MLREGKGLGVCPVLRWGRGTGDEDSRGQGLRVVRDARAEGCSELRGGPGLRDAQSCWSCEFRVLEVIFTRNTVISYWSDCNQSSGLGDT